MKVSIMIKLRSTLLSSAFFLFLLSLTVSHVTSDLTLVPQAHAQSSSTCQSQQPVNTQFRFSGNGPWVSGNDLTNQRPTVGQQIDVNCFAKNGTALLEGGYIDVIFNGGTYRVSNTAELRNATLQNPGSYHFTCRSASITSCEDSDAITVYSAVTLPTPTPRPTPTPIPTPLPTPQPTVISTPTPTPTPQNPHYSTCDSLQVISGNDSLVPAKVTFRARGSDNKGGIQRYRYYFGDGEQQDTDQAEVTHEYKSSGTFIARADIKDSQGNYKTSSACEATVRVKPSSIESFRSACSDIFISADNNGKAPSTVKYDVTGFDNKGSIQGYRMDFGNGVVKDGAGRSFEQRYDTSGTYEVRAYIKNSNGEYVGGTDSCKRLVTIGSSEPLRSQPSTGTPTLLPLLGLGSGVVGSVLRFIKKDRLV